MIEELSTATIAALISAIVEMFPPLRERWDVLTSRQKQGAVLVAAAVVAIIAAVVRCGFYGACPADWIQWGVALMMNFIAALTGSAAAHYNTNYLTKPAPSPDIEGHPAT